MPCNRVFGYAADALKTHSPLRPQQVDDLMYPL